MHSLRRYIGAGFVIGFLGGLAEATIVHRPGLFFIPYAALAYGLLFSAAFAVFAFVDRSLRRDLLPLALGASATFFIALQAAFWINKKSPMPVGSRQSMVINGAILLSTIGVGFVIYLMSRRRLRRPDLSKSALWLLVIAVATLSIYFGSTYFSSKPGLNCVLISIDALRPDHLSCYGYHRITSSNTDRLAAEGALWLRAFTQSPGSTGGHASMLTGFYTLSHGAYVNGILLDDSVETAAEVFARNGHTTAAFTNNWYISPAVGFGQGFDCFIDDGYGLILRSASPRILLRGLVLYQTIHRVLRKPGYPSDLEIKDAIDWIRFNGKQPFFVFLHIMDPHSPYIPPRSFLGRFGHEGLDLRPEHIERLHGESLERGLSPDESRVLFDRYDEEILSADSKIGLLVNELAHLGILSNTMIVITADHGEVMGEGTEKQFGHGTLDYGSLRIPLIMSLPGKIPEGRRFETTALSIDILPTIVDVLQLEDRVRRQGISLLSSEVDSVDTKRPAFATGEILARDDYSVVAGEWQYTISGDQLSLYDLRGNPYDAPNVIRENPAVADSLQLLVEGWIEKCRAEAIVPYSIEGRSVTPGRDALRRLKALGYIQ